MTKSFPIVLMYHGVVAESSDIPPDREEGAGLYDLLAQRFSEQMEFLNQQNVEPGKILITFDDGERNNIKRAFPILRQFGFSAYFFVTVNRIGKKGYMNWEELKELRDANMVIGSHGVNHVIMTGLKDKDIERELFQSKEVLERNLKVNVEDFSVSRGFYNEKILNTAQEVGYKQVFVSERNDQLSQQNVIGRVAVKAEWSLKRFEQAIRGEVPLEEAGVNVVNSLVKKSLGNTGYDKFRKIFLGQRSKNSKVS